MHDIHDLLAPIQTLHALIRDRVLLACETAALESLSEIAHEAEGDTIYAVDRVSEELLIEFCEREIAPFAPIILIAEGLPEAGVLLPREAKAEDAVWRIIVDPIDGTRGLMYQKRAAWILTGVAPNRGASTQMGDIGLAVQTEVPLVKQHLSDELWAFEGEGFGARRFNRLTREYSALPLRPSQSETVAHGFAALSRFFPGAREVLAEIDEEIIRGALGPVHRGKTACFEDQYISSGGQLYELIAGHDRFIADLRPLMEKVLARRGQALGICCHPYDLCTELIAREAGVLVTDEYGNNLTALLDLESEMAWCGYANEKIRAQIEPLLQAALNARELL